MFELITYSILAFLALILLMVFMLLYAKSKLVNSGAVKIKINGENEIEVGGGSTLLTTLGNNKIFLPSACGGGGSCLQCKCKVLDGGGEPLPTEIPNFTRKELAEGWRLGCQVKVKQDMVIEVPEEIFGIKKFEAKVYSNYNVASFIKEFIVELPEDMHYEAGGYIQIEIPACEVKFTDIDITAHPVEHPGEPDKFQVEWDKFKLWPLVMKNNELVERAYSMASYPAEGRKIMLNVRIATPPFDRATNDWMKVNPGIASSYVFSRKAGDTVTVSGPYGEFFIKPTDNEIVFVGGGAGMAPMRSHIFHLFHTEKTTRKVSFWYGARSLREVFYEEEFRAIEKEFPNFKFHIALSEAKPEDNWTGLTGFIHKALLDNYLSKHDSPEDIEYYLCGPPMMNSAVTNMLDSLGVPEENVAFDDFGG